MHAEWPKANLFGVFKHCHKPKHVWFIGILHFLDSDSVDADRKHGKREGVCDMQQRSSARNANVTLINGHFGGKELIKYPALFVF